jgi:hypothetical protein
LQTSSNAELVSPIPSSNIPAEALQFSYVSAVQHLRTEATTASLNYSIRRGVLDNQEFGNLAHARHNVINTNLKYSKHFKPLTGSSFGRKVEIPTPSHISLVTCMFLNECIAYHPLIRFQCLMNRLSLSGFVNTSAG